MNKRLLAGLMLFGIAGLFLSLCGFYFVRAYSMYFDDVRRPEGVPCDSCPMAQQSMLSNAKLLGIIGGITGALGAWFTVAGYNMQKATA